MKPVSLFETSLIFFWNQLKNFETSFTFEVLKRDFYFRGCIKKMGLGFFGGRKKDLRSMVDYSFLLFFPICPLFLFCLSTYIALFFLSLSPVYLFYLFVLNTVCFYPPLSFFFASFIRDWTPRLQLRKPLYLPLDYAATGWDCIVIY